MAEQAMDFDGLRIAYDEEVLEPRPWTLAQSRWAVDLLDDVAPGPVLELCAGAGQIGLVVGRDTGRPLVQVDADPEACAFARRNAEAAGVAADVRCGELDEVLAAEERFPFVLADPPYIRADEVHALPDDPNGAIDGGEDGLDIARTCVRVAAAHLLPGGLVLIQLGSHDQTSRLGVEAESFGLTPIETRTHAADRALLLLRSG